MTAAGGHSNHGGADGPVNRRALVGGTLISGNGGEPIERGTLLIEGAKIVGIGAQNQVPIPDQTEVAVMTRSPACVCAREWRQVRLDPAGPGPLASREIAVSCGCLRESLQGRLQARSRFGGQVGECALFNGRDRCDYRASRDAALIGHLDMHRPAVARRRAPPDQAAHFQPVQHAGHSG